MSDTNLISGGICVYCRQCTIASQRKKALRTLRRQHRIKVSEEGVVNSLVAGLGSSGGSAGELPHDLPSQERTDLFRS